MIHSEAAAVTVLPELFAAARRAGLQQPYSTWLQLRALDDGRGWLPWKAAVEGLQQCAKIARPTAYAWLRADPDQTFWRISRQRHGSKVIYLSGVAKVHAALGSPRLGRMSFVPASEFRGARGRRRAHLMGHIAVHQVQRTLIDPDGQPTKPLSRRAIENGTTISASSQRRYQRIGGITSHPNVLIRSEGPTPEEALLRGMWCVNGTWFEPLPNSYSVTGVRIGGKKTTQRLNSKLAPVGGPLATPSRRYYHRVRGFIRHSGAGERFLAVQRCGGITYWRG